MNATIALDAERSGPILALRPWDVSQLRWEPVPGCPGVIAKVVWHSATGLYDTLISYEPGASTPGPPHLDADQHIWVIVGSVSLAGRRLVAGSFVHVPAGVKHPIVGGSPRGCLLLQMHRPLPRPADGP